MKPLLDCMEDILGDPSLVKALMEEGCIEFVNIGHMRGRTFKNSFIILDEAQNATKQQLRLALTRIGEGSKCVVTADKRQIDIKPETSCISDISRFVGVPEVGIVIFSDKDVVRSKICQIVNNCYGDDDGTT